LAQTDLRNLKQFGPHPQKRLDKFRFRTYTGAGDTLRKSSSYYYWRARAKNANDSHLGIVLIWESFSFANRSHLGMRIILIGKNKKIRKKRIYCKKSPFGDLG
jgi:hypothetical protein